MIQDQHRLVTYEMLARALFDNYESIYVIDVETNSYNVFHESKSYQQLKLTSCGENFFETFPEEAARVIAPQDLQHVLGHLTKDALLEGVKNSKPYSFVYRIERDGQQRFHQLRAIAQLIEDKQHILMGVRDVDALVRQQIAYRDEIDARQQKEHNYLKAILDAAAAYIDANLTTDEVLKQSSNVEEGNAVPLSIPTTHESFSSYDALQKWISDTIVNENREKYREICSRDYLLRCFMNGERSTSVRFSIDDGTGTRPYREVFYLYRENTSGDIHALCVAYDLTQQQKRDHEIAELEYELHLSRIRNSTSQMKPHFLYNVLGSIQEVILENPAYASELLEDFTFYLRGCLKAMDSDRPIPFAQEIENIKAYTSIEKMRFGNKLLIRYDLEDIDFPILPLSVQPLVENAIRHGIYQRKADGGVVTISSWAERDKWVVQVQDTGVGFDVDALNHQVRRAETDSSGLKNIRFRLEKVMGASLYVTSVVGRGTTATIHIPREDRAYAGNYR